MEKNFEDISEKDLNKTFTFRGKITTIKQTSGPTLMILNDGTANFTFKAFLKPGVRAYPEVNIGDYVSVTATIYDRNGNLEGEVLDMEKLGDEELKKFRENVIILNKNKAKPDTTEFTIKSDVLESLKDRFIKVTKIIKRAIIEGRPILLRHNADTDGYSSAITLERAILGFMDEITGGDLQYKYNNYRRAPSKAPFYEYEDSIKDLTLWLKDRVKNNVKTPLIIITDNGSTEEDLLSIKQMKIFDATIVVIDHHYPGEIKDGKALVDDYIDGHINPYLTGYDSNVCAGMLGYELANFIYKKNENSVFIPAMAAIMDHTEGPERDQYIQKAEKEGYTKEYLENLGEITDMFSFYLKFLEAREFVDKVFQNDKNVQNQIVDLLKPDIKKRYENVEKTIRHYSEITDLKDKYLIFYDGERGTLRGEYPPIGKTTNHMHKIYEKELDKPIISMTYGSNFITIRCSDEIRNFSVPEIVKKLNEMMPYALISGGGHEHAGSVKFVEFSKNEVLSKIKELVKNI